MCSEYQCKYVALDICHLPSHLKSEDVLLDGVPVLPWLSNVPALESKEYGGSLHQASYECPCSQVVTFIDKEKKEDKEN